MKLQAIRTALLAALLSVQISPLFALTKDALAGARPMAMGGAFTAVANDYNAPVWNAAAMDYKIYRPQFGINYVKHFEDINQYYFSMIYPTTSKGTFGIYLDMYDYGTLTRYDSIGNRLADFYRKDITGGLAYGKKLRVSLGSAFETYINVGGTIKYAYADLGDYSTASGYSADLSAFWPVSNTFSAAAAIKNIGGLTLKDEAGVEQKIEPASTRLGFSVKASKDLLISGDMERVSGEADTNYSVGAEFGLLGMKLRSGILAYKKSVSLGAGFGLGKEKGLNFDYAFLNQADLGKNHRLSVSLPFGRDVYSEREEIEAKKQIVEEALEGNKMTKLAIRGLLSSDMAEDSQNNAKVFLDMFENALTNEKVFEVYERKDMVVLAEERSEQDTGTLSKIVQSEYLAKGVSRVMSVIVKTIGGKLSLLIKLINAETGKILLSEMETSPMDEKELKETAHKMAQNLSAPFKNLGAEN